LIRTVTLRCSLPKAEADALNLESGAVYTRVLVEHYRVYRHTGHWLSVGAACRIEDYRGGPTILHAHSRDAAQQAFYKAIKTARTNRKDGLGAKYPHKHKRFRTTVWKNTGMRVRDGVLLLARARGLEPVRVGLPPHLVELPEDGFREARLVWDHATRHYEWHLVVENGQSPEGSPGDNVVAVDLGEIHPAALTDGEDAVIVSCRALRSLNQYTNKRLAKLSHKQAAKVKGSRGWRRLQRRRSKFLAQQRRRKRDIEHKVSREVVNWAIERKAGMIVIGDVRDVADGKRLNRKSQQKVGTWSHGKQRQYITYKAAAEGIEVALQDEARLAHSAGTGTSQPGASMRVGGVVSWAIETLWEQAISCHSPCTARLGRSSRPARSSIVSHSVGHTKERSNGPSLMREPLTRGEESVVPWTRGKWLLQVW
jgi:putative transposase